MRANNCAKNTRNPNSCSKVIAWTRICGRRRRTNRYKNSHPPVFRGDLNSTLSSHCEIAHRWMPQNLNSLRRSDPYMRQYTRPSFLKVICTVINPILLTYLLTWRYQLLAWPAPSQYLNQCRNIVNSNLRNKLEWNQAIWNTANVILFHSRKLIWKCGLENGGHFVSATTC